MSLRTRLTIAFFAISVIPLSAVTFYSYISSERALRRAAEQQAATMAAELGHRMEWVTQDLGRRMDRVWPMPDLRQLASTAASTPPAAPRPDVSMQLAQVLGDIAPMIE
jgi:sensor histidine kinase regulating citrate/malate metabolism